MNNTSSLVNNNTMAEAQVTNLPDAISFLESQGCSVMCSSNDTVDTANAKTDIINLNFLTHTSSAEWLEPIARHFSDTYSGRVNVSFASYGFEELFANIIDQAAEGSNLYDGFVTPPSVAGSIVQYNGWQDLTPFIQGNGDRASDWADILLGYQKTIAQYEGKIIMYPLDGDILSLYYRKDVLQHFGLRVPRTWDEYNQVAEAVHGQQYENITLVGSCVGRVIDFAGPYWANLIISSMTQTLGQFEGHLFSTIDMKPLTGPVIDQALAWMEQQVKYGAPGEFEQGFPINFDAMYSGECVMTYNWGNNFKQYMEPGSHLIGGKYGIATTPGSTMVLDRESMQLVPCDADRCKNGVYYDDIGWVNVAPYLAFGGFGCAVNNFTDPSKKYVATEFCAFASSKDVSIETIIPYAQGNGTQNGQDPYRASHLDQKRYESQGYEPEATKEFLTTIKSGIDHPNAVVDIRFPTASDLNSVLDHMFHDYLNATLYGAIPESQRAATRASISSSLTQQWTDIINAYDALPTTRVPILETEQRLRGVYVPQKTQNQIDGIRIYGYVLLGLIVAFATAAIAWTVRYKKMHIVRASQPVFLVMICFGAIVFGSVIVSFSIDDSMASDAQCSKACMSIPWLVFLGWSILFSALFAKIWRVNIVYQNSMKFRRLKVSEADVLRPFAVLFLSNVTFLLVWTLLDPLTWTRVYTSPTDSYGTCNASDSYVWKICISFLAILNGAALFLANFQAYRARKLSTEYGESKYIGMAMACILQVTLVGVPLLFLVNTNPPANYFVRCTIVFVVCMSILLLIFVPKMWHFYRNRKMTSLAQSTTQGLTFRVLEKETLFAQEAKYQAFKGKVLQLKDLLQAQGLDASKLMDEVGLTDDLKMSTVVSSDSQQERYPNHLNPTGPITSSLAESLVSSRANNNSGYENSDDGYEIGRRVSFLDQIQARRRNNSTDEIAGDGEISSPDAEAVDDVGSAVLPGPDEFCRLEI